MRRYLAFLLLLPAALRAQERGAASLHETVRGLGNTVRVLMIGAHPDDEDTQLLAWLARGRQVETAYLSLTRGDGGQNLIGNELGEALGVIRTEELLAARRVDGAHQYFTRAFDFGFSKTAEETYAHWPKDTLLRDVVAIVRSFRPHVIVAVFSGTPRDGHGHHQVSGQLARLAYDFAGDSVRFPARAIGGLAPWTPLKFYRGVFAFQGVNPDTLATLKVNVGEYNPVLGRSYAEIAGESRSQHLSQGFGSLQPKGVRWSYLAREASRASGAPADARQEKDLFDGIDTTWGRFASLPSRSPQFDSLAAAVDALRLVAESVDPQRLVAPLATVARLLGHASAQCPSAGACTLHSDFENSLLYAGERANRALARAAGVSVEAFAPRELVALGDTIPVQLEIHNRGRAPVTLRAAWVQAIGNQGLKDGSNRADTTLATIAPDSMLRVTRRLVASKLTVPWWRAQPRRGDLFQLEPPGVRMLPGVAAEGTRASDRGESWHPAPEMLVGEDGVWYTAAVAMLEIAGTTVAADAGPIVYRYADPARGEMRRPVTVVPPIAVSLERGVEYVRAGAPVQRQERVHVVSALTTPWTGRVSLRLPAGLTADSAARTVTVPAGGSVDVDFLVQGRLAKGFTRVDASAQAVADTSRRPPFVQGYTTIEYPHIRPQRFYRSATTVVSSVDVKVPEGMRVAYVQGVGDNGAPMLRQLGIPVAIVDADTLATADLSRFTTLVVGPRAYEAHPALRASAGRVLDFARRGGTVVVQYGQTEMAQPGLMPFPITHARPADRVTEENAAVTVLDPTSFLLVAPNKLSAEDWAGWVQERSLYMPRTIDQRYATPLSMHDTGEPENRGAILATPLGRGMYVYTTLSFHRQLPGGIPGAARLFVNLLSARPVEGESARP